MAPIRHILPAFDRAPSPLRFGLEDAGMTRDTKALADTLRSGVLWTITLVALGMASIHGSNGPQSVHAAPGNLDGSSSECEPWRVTFDLLLFEFDLEQAEEGWVYVNGYGTEDRFREASGVVTKSKIAHNDFPATHYTHDWNVDIRVDPGQEGLVSDANGPDGTGKNIELEWETGIENGETSGDGASPFIPRWVLPNLGDRAWTNGHWVFDCGHYREVDGVKHFPSEIHPGRALATMRPQAATLPGSGTTPVPVTATDLYIHGRGAFMVQQLECGIDIIITGSSCPVTTTPIDDIYTFEICLPPRPVAWATLSSQISIGPGDSGIPVPLELDEAEAVGGCDAAVDDFGNDFDNEVMYEATVDLRGSGIAPTDVYARKVVAGWVYPPSEPLPHLSLDLTRLDLHNDHEVDPGDGEMTFWFMGLDRATDDEWHRLVNWEIPTYEDVQFPCPNQTNHLNDMDDDSDLSCGNGLLDFSGPNWSFYLRHGQSLSLHTTGYEQDCLDDYFGSGEIEISAYADCYFLAAFALNPGMDDALPPMSEYIVAPGVDPRTVLGAHNPGVSGEFDFDLTLGEIPLADEDTADVGVSKSCAWEGEVALAGDPFTCTIVVSNAGPGLPRDVVVTDALTSSLAASDYTVGGATFRVGATAETYSCGASTATGFSCAIGTVPVGGTVTIEVVITPIKPGSFTNTATVATDSTDGNGGNDESSGVEVEVYLPVPLDISPGSSLNPLNLSKGGVMSVAILTTGAFDASQLVIAEACFGDAESPGDRTCSEVHGAPHVTDVDKDKDKDLDFHFSVAETGIDLGDTSACIKGTTSAGIGFYGCDRVTPF